jgi:hypothetical protein
MVGDEVRLQSEVWTLGKTKERPEGSSPWLACLAAALSLR